MGSLCKYCLISFTLLVLSCENSSREVSSTKYEPEDTSSASWRLIASNSFNFSKSGLTPFQLLFKFGYTDLGDLDRLWIYDNRAETFSQSYLDDNTIFTEYVGGGVFFTLDGFLSLENWQLPQGLNVRDLINESNFFAPYGSGVISSIVATDIYSPTIGIIGKIDHSAAVPYTLFDLDQFKADDSDLDVWRKVDSQLALVHSEAVVNYYSSTDSTNVRDWLAHYTSVYSDAEKQTLHIDLYPCYPPYYEFAGVFNPPSESQTDFIELSFLMRNPIADLPEFPCHSIEIERSADKNLKHVRIKTFISSLDVYESVTDIHYTYKLEDNLLFINVEKTVSYLNAEELNKSDHLWAVYEKNACSIELKENENNRIPNPFHFCVNF